MKELSYSFDAEYIIKKKKSLKRQLLADVNRNFVEKRIAILGGETTENIKLTLELFLLNYGIKPYFYESEYNQYYEDGMFPNQELEEFKPDIIYICTCVRNIIDFPVLSDQKEVVEQKKQAVVDKFYGLWDSVAERYHCPIVQNNFEYPFFRLMGNKDASDYHGRVNFVTMLNCAFYEYAQKHDNFYICDVNYISASYGLDKWSEPYYWHMYKYAVAVPVMDGVEHYIQILDKSGFFEVTALSQDDLKRNEMYQENAKRSKLQSSFVNYEDYLKSLEMKGEIQSFVPMYMSRIAQLTNKSNQFNLTTKRYSQSDIENVAADPDRITLYGKLGDKFGDNGVVSIVIGRIDGDHRDELHMELWLMSCRVLKRDMEFAMMDELVEKAKAAGIKKLVGYYYPTAKNAMVKEFYALQGFKKITEDEAGNTVWEFMIDDSYKKKQHVIAVNERKE